MKLDEWCESCAEYDHETHSCPRFNHVIRTTLDDVRKDAYKHGKSKGIKKGLAMAQRIKGRWLKKENVGRWDDTLWECSECGCLHRDNVFCISGDFNFCPNCGAEMKQ